MSRILAARSAACSDPNITRRATTAVFAATVLASIPLVLGFFADGHPAFDSLGHFRAHLAVLLMAGGLALLASRYWKHGLLAVALGMAALWTTLSSFAVSGSGQRSRQCASRRARGLSPAAAQSALRQQDARTGAVADRACAARRDHARRGVGRLEAAAQADLGDVSVRDRLRRAAAGRRRGDRVAAADRRGRGRQMSRRRLLRHSTDRFRRAPARGRGAASAMAVAVRAGSAARRPRRAAWRARPDGAACRRLQRRDLERHACGASRPMPGSSTSPGSGRAGSTAGCPMCCGPMPACRSTRSWPRAIS